MLDLVGYQGADILQKHIIDNSCGNGAFLCEIVARYTKAHGEQYGTYQGLHTHLQTYIHGIEIDWNAYCECLQNLNHTMRFYGVSDVAWDIVCGDTLLQKQFDNKMDFVVGNPPYVRVHHLQDIERVKKFSFAQSGMVDLYLVFYEIGFAMLGAKGKLCYITPNSFYNSLAGKHFRHFIESTGHLTKLIDLGHYQPFDFVTYTTIGVFDFAQRSHKFAFAKYQSNGNIAWIDTLHMQDIVCNGKFFLGQGEQSQAKQIQSYVPKQSGLFVVKNAYATLADSVFIKESFEFGAKSKYIIDVCKASTQEWKQCIYPYEDNGNLVGFAELDKPLQQYLLEKKSQLQNRSLDAKTGWYAFGRSQAIKDTQKNKIAISTILKDVASIKLTEIVAGQGVYSGLYILTDLTFEHIASILKTEDFVSYVVALGKYKNGGYYSFSSSDLYKYLIYQAENKNE